MTKLWLALVLIPAAAAATPKSAARLDNLVGAWKGTGSVTAGKDKAPVTGDWVCKKTAAASGVLCTLEMKGIPGVATYAETDLFGYEPNTDTLHWFSVTNAGETHDHVAKPADGKLQFVFKGTQDGKPLVETVDMDFAKDLTIRAETKVGDQVQSVLEVKVKKS
jgi:hypothetical protein